MYGKEIFNDTMTVNYEYNVEGQKFEKTTQKHKRYSGYFQIDRWTKKLLVVQWEKIQRSHLEPACRWSYPTLYPIDRLVFFVCTIRVQFLGN